MQITNKETLKQYWGDFFQSSRPAVIYGAGRQATVVYEFCTMYKKPCFCLLATESRERWGALPSRKDLPLYLQSEFPADLSKKDYDVIVAVNSVYNAEISAHLKEDGWPNITLVENWDSANNAARRYFYDDYFTRKGARFNEDSEGATWMECPSKHGFFKIYYDIDPVYNSNILGVLHYIVLPSVFDDYSCCGIRGCYENDPVVMRPEDTVFVLGACVGVFSCVAASRGCKVHAFEPTPLTVEKYLRKNASLYNDAITVVERAVYNERKKIPFYINPDLEKTTDINRHSLFQDLEPGYMEIEVEAITLDSYVAENRIGQVNFIRSFTEYAEKYIFDGSCSGETLNAFKPKLSYVKGYPENASLLRNRLEERGYRVIMQKWQSFAWVPGIKEAH